MLKRAHFFSTLLCAVILASLITGCSNVEQRRLQQLNRIKPFAIDQIILLADASASMSSDQKILQEVDFLGSFIQAMPEGDYGAGLMAFNSKSYVLRKLLPFNRNILYSRVGKLVNMGGLTKLETALKNMENDLKGTTGRTAIVIVSDGLSIDFNNALKAGEQLVANHPNKVCIHTVQIGQDNKGTAILLRLSQLTGCGSFRFAGTVIPQPALTGFVHEVFFGLDKPATAPQEEPSVDADGDGVPDGKDECPDTPKGAKVDSRGCWVIPNLEFDYDKYIVRPQYYPELDDVVSVLQKNAGLNVRLDGHTDSIGSERYNVKLSNHRANAVKEYLVEKGIEDARLTTQGWGFSKPVKPNDTEENRQANRRVEVTPVK